MARLNGRARVGWALLCAAALCAPLAGGFAPARADQGWWGDLDKGQSVRLGDVIASPERFRGRTLTFTCVYHRPEREFNPLRTRFNAERYDNVSVWPDASEVWAQKDFENDFPFLYVARNHPQRDALLRLDAFTRLEVTGRIEAVLTNTPFIEVTGWKLTGHRLGKDVVEAMMRGETYARSGDPDARGIAIDNYRRALSLLPDLAPAYAEKIRARLAKALEEAGRADEAATVRAGAVAPAGPYDPGEPAPPAMLPGEDLPVPPPQAGSPDAGPLPSSTLPGTPADEPLARPPVRPVPAGSQPPSAAAVPPPEPPGSTLPADGPPAGLGSPTLPGTPWDQPPAARAPLVAPPLAPARAVPRGAPSGPLPAPAAVPAPALLPPGAEAPAAAPVVVDPPLPPPAPGGAPPPRRPRLAGVK